MVNKGRATQLLGEIISQKFDIIDRKVVENLLYKLAKNSIAASKKLLDTLSNLSKERWRNLVDDRLLMRLTPRAMDYVYDSASRYVALTIQENFDKISKSIRNKIILILDEDWCVRQKLWMFAVKTYESSRFEMSGPYDQEIIEVYQSLSDNDTLGIYLAQILDKNPDKILQNIASKMRRRNYQDNRLKRVGFH